MGAYVTMSILDKQLWRDATPLPPKTRAMSKSGRALVVEDSPLIAMDLAQMLESAGMVEVVEAASLAEARTALETGPFDLVLLDVMLPDGSAADLLPRLTGMSVIVVSAYGPEDLPRDFEGLPLLSKPVRQEDLVEMVAHYSATASGQVTR